MPQIKWPIYIFQILFAGLVLLLYGNILLGAFTKVWGINFEFTLDHLRFVLAGYGFEAIGDTVLLAGTATPISGLVGMLIAFLVVRRQAGVFSSKKIGISAKYWKTYRKNIG